MLTCLRSLVTSSCCVITPVTALLDAKLRVSGEDISRLESGLREGLLNSNSIVYFTN